MLSSLSIRRPAAAISLVVIGVSLFVAAFLVSSAVSRMGAPAAGSSSAQIATWGARCLNHSRQIGALQERLRQQSDDHVAATRLGLAYLQRARETSDPSYYTRADGVLNQALDAAPGDTDTLIGLGSLALARHQFTDALEWGNKAVASNPYKAAAYGIVGDAYTELGQYEDAIGAIQKMVDLRPDQTSYARVSYARELHGDLAGAIGAMRDAVDAARAPARNTESGRACSSATCTSRRATWTRRGRRTRNLSSATGYVYATGAGSRRCSARRLRHAIRCITTSRQRAVD
jgi:tetratricopeptide (TPR) repeat protein